MALDVVATPTLAVPNEPTDVSQANPAAQIHWAVTGYEADASTAIAIKAAVTGSYHYLTHVIIVCVDDDALPQLQDNAGTPNLLFGPVCGQATGGTVINHRFRRPLKMDVSTALAVKAAAAGIFSVYVEGFTATS